MKNKNLIVKEGTLVISLDFELLWGVFDKVNWNEKKVYFENTVKVIPKILDLFDKYEISCTWATVGMLFNANWDEWNSNIPKRVPDYSNQNLSAYKFGKSIQRKDTEDLCFAPQLIKQIIESENQELATHTYSHYYCKEDGQTLDDFDSDIMLSIEIARKFGAETQSLVFPRNQLNSKYLSNCKDLGIQNVRSNPKNWYWAETENNTIQQKIFRTGDAYFGLKDKPYNFSDIEELNQLCVQPASRLLRPYSGRTLLDKFKLKRIINEISYAARSEKIYHLWWHPHNFGENPEQNLKDLESILVHFTKCRNQFGFASHSMESLRKKLAGE